jgi:fatty acid synthase
MANSVMERIIEKRHRDGLPAKAIQLGAIGDVGAYNLYFKILIKSGVAKDSIVPQPISNFLDSLDVLIRSPEPIITSMVITDKVSGETSKIGFMEKFKAKYGIQTNTPLESTLIELGVDSFSFLDLKQDIEMETGRQIEIEDLKSLTLKQVIELSKGETLSKPKTDVCDSKKTTALMKFLLEDSEKDKFINATIVKLNNINNDTNELPCVLLIPGNEGITNAVLCYIADSLKLPTFALHYHNTWACGSVQEITESVYKVTN